MTSQIASGRLTVLWNLKSGWEAGEQQAEAVRAILQNIATDVEIRQVQGRDIRELAEEALRQGSTMLVAAGGDGTVNAVSAVAASYRGSEPIRLGIIPAGTLNHFARDLGISLVPETAARQLESGREIAVDLGEVNGRIFINNSVLGLYPVYRAARRAIEQRGLGHTAFGRLLAVIGGMMRVFWHLPALRLRLISRDHALNRDRIIEMTSAFVLIANNEHDLEKDRIGKRTSLSAGHLWVYVLKPCSRWRLLLYFLQYVSGMFSRGDAFEEFVAAEVRIETKRRKRIGVSIDGEIVHLPSPLNYRSLPAALRVIAPADCPISS